jgi:hypothetical protein
MGFFNILKKAFDPRTPFRQAKGIANAAKSGDWKGVLRGVSTAGIPMGLPGAQQAAEMPFRAAQAAKNGDWKGLVAGMVPGAGAMQAAASGDWKGAAARLANPMGEMGAAMQNIGNTALPGEAPRVAFAKGGAAGQPQSFAQGGAAGQPQAFAQSPMTAMLKGNFGGNTFGDNGASVAEGGGFAPRGGGFTGGLPVQRPVAAAQQAAAPDANAIRKARLAGGRGWNGQV